jgi:hypothetical protein
MIRTASATKFLVLHPAFPEHQFNHHDLPIPDPVLLRVSAVRFRLSNFGDAWRFRILAIVF